MAHQRAGPGHQAHPVLSPERSEDQDTSAPPPHLVSEPVKDTFNSPLKNVMKHPKKALFFMNTWQNFHISKIIYICIMCSFWTTFITINSWFRFKWWNVFFLDMWSGTMLNKHTKMKEWDCKTSQAQKTYKSLGQ